MRRALLWAQWDVGIMPPFSACSKGAGRYHTAITPIMSKPGASWQAALLLPGYGLKYEDSPRS